MLYEFSMGFWKNVEERRIYLGLTRKDLAQRAGIKYAVIGAGLERDSVPAANTALRIANALHIPLENLLGDDFNQSLYESGNSDVAKNLAELQKYRNVYEDLEKLTNETKKSLTEMIHKLANEAEELQKKLTAPPLLPEPPEW
ncbi:MAG: helix-turn-helix domain-containing protein [Treponema sp.]|nr:helix-turn-helix domain-containing protein [Treponema sp.]